MESGTSNEKSIKSDILKVENIFWAVVTTLVLALVYIYRDTFGVAGIIIALLALITIFIGYRNYKLKEDIKKLYSCEAKKNEVRNLYLKHLLDPRTILGSDVILKENADGYMVATMTFTKDECAEILAFSQDKFNFSVIREGKFAEIKGTKEKILTVPILRKYNIEPETAYVNTTSFKTRLVIPESDVYVFIFTKSHESRAGDIEVSFLMANVPPEG